MEKVGVDMEGDGGKQQRKRVEVEATLTEVWLSIVVLVIDVAGQPYLWFNGSSLGFI